MMLENIVYNWLTNEGELFSDQVSSILEEKEDVEIALDIWEELRYPDYTLDEIENEVSYFRKTRPDKKSSNAEYEY